ncbi:unnamed protein product [Didymodactylos carnosus]|uniref:SH2 domain-containing protein n=1 Tax=Didymodactylos carnosus TaxID=1234261 RepID=A0A813QF44_9BILA|nr:unnamed protein product [Didymodactylos carnosus]CAF3547596.1 unnamed protein product [Didymodactylos carnosus]
MDNSSLLLFEHFILQLRKTLIHEQSKMISHEIDKRQNLETSLIIDDQENKENIVNIFYMKSGELPNLILNKRAIIKQDQNHIKFFDLNLNQLIISIETDDTIECRQMTKLDKKLLPHIQEQQSLLSSKTSLFLKNLNDCPWFHYHLSRRDAARLVVQTYPSDGNYLIRQSETRPGEYVLTFNHSGKAKHLRMFIDSDGFCHCQHLIFDSIQQLIDHFHYNRIPLESGSNSSSSTAYLKQFIPRLLPRLPLTVQTPTTDNSYAFS